MLKDKNLYKELKAICAMHNFDLDSEEFCLDIDNVMKNYCRKLHIDNRCSVDCIYIKGCKCDFDNFVKRINGEKFFIEFKNTKIDKLDCDNINKKIYNTLILYFGTINDSIYNFRNFTEFYLVVDSSCEELNEKMNMGSAKNFLCPETKNSLKGLFSVLNIYFKYCFKYCDIISFNNFKTKLLCDDK